MSKLRNEKQENSNQRDFFLVAAICFYLNPIVMDQSFAEVLACLFFGTFFLINAIIKSFKVKKR